MLTRRTAQRAFFLRPDYEVVRDCYFILGLLQVKYDITYHTVSILSNHLHMLLTDVLGDQLQGFNRDLFSLMARSINCFRGRSENLWSTDKPNCVAVAPRAEDVIDKASYINCNPVEAGLVSHVKKWPGVRVLASEMGTRKIRVQRPEFFYDPDGDLPEEVEVTFTLPKVWDASPEELRLGIEQECNRREQDVRDRFKRDGLKFMGAKRVLRQSTNSAPRTPESLFRLVPHVACKNTPLRVKYLEWRKERQSRYNERRALLLAGEKGVVFPEGTYALHFQGGQQREDWQA